MTRETIEEQIRIIKEAGEKHSVSREAVMDFLTRAGIYPVAEMSVQSERHGKFPKNYPQAPREKNNAQFSVV